MSKTLTVRQDIGLQDIGRILAKSGFFSDASQEAQAIVKVLAGAELGFGPIASMTGIHIVKGKVTLSANLMAAAIKRSGVYTYHIKEHTVALCSIEFFEGSQSLGVSSFSMEDAKAAGVLSNRTWKSYPRNMLFARAMSNGARWFCPDIFGGPIYASDELEAEVDDETGEIIEGSAVVFETPVVESEQATPESVKKKLLDRPMDAFQVRDALRVRGGERDESANQLMASEAQIPLLARKFTECFAGDSDAVQEYHTCLSWLWGVDSAKDLTLTQARATLKWLLGKEKDEAGDWPLHPDAPEEAGRVLRQALKDAGQGDFFEIADDDIPASLDDVGEIPL